MTIALGILVSDAMIVAADTQVTVPNYLKTGEGKIRWTIDSPTKKKQWGVLAVTGAGRSAYLESIQQELTKVFLKHPSATMDELEELFRKALRAFYKDHVIPFSSYGPDRPDFWLIVAASRGIYQRMWATDMSALRVVSGHASVGIGEMQATILLNRLALPQDIETAQLLAAYVVYHVKEVIPECGKDTDVICIQNGAVFGLHRLQVRALEAVFGKHAVLEARLVHRILGSQHDFAQPDQITQKIEDLRSEICHIIHPTKPTPVASSESEET